MLVAAYDDAAGVTAAFNKNILSVLNAELGANFDPDAFDHVALWDPAAEWIEMRLRSAGRQQVRLPGHRADRDLRRGRGDAHRGLGQVPPRGSTGRTRRGGPAMTSWWTDEESRFGLSLSVPC